MSLNKELPELESIKEKVRLDYPSITIAWSRPSYWNDATVLNKMRRLKDYVPFRQRVVLIDHKTGLSSQFKYESVNHTFQKIRELATPSTPQKESK